MLCAGEQVAAHVVREREVACSVDRRVGEGSRAPLAPVLDRGIRVDHFRLQPCWIAEEETATPSGCIDLLEIGVRKPCRRKRRIARHGEALVERPQAGSGDVRPYEIKGHAITLVGVEPVVEELAEEPPALRDAEHIRRASADRKNRKSTRLNSSHSQISYAVFCLKKK